MKSYKQFLSESINVSGDFNGNIYMGQSPEAVEEKYTADMEWNGELYQIEMVYDGTIPERNQLTEMIQDEYPGAIVQNVYPVKRAGQSKVLTTKKIVHQSEWS